METIIWIVVTLSVVALMAAAIWGLNELGKRRGARQRTEQEG